jgi:hypothetical protein
VFLFRKPFKGALFKNVLKHGVGGLNIDATRVEHASPEDFAKHKAMVDRLREKGGSLGNSWKNSSDLSGANEVTAKGRWPTNLVLVHTAECRCVGTRKVKGIRGGSTPVRRGGAHAAAKGYQTPGRGQTYCDYANKDGSETVSAWACSPKCSAPRLDHQSGNRPGMSGGGLHRKGYKGGLFGGIDCSHTARGDEGGASRFLPQFEDFDGLIEWLKKLITPPEEECLVRLA